MTTLLCFSGSCSFLNSENQLARSSKLYSSFQNTNWTKVDSDEVDILFKNYQTQSVFSVNSNCSQFNQKSILYSANSLMSDFDKLKILIKREITFKNHDALEIKATAEIDGINTFFTLISTKVDKCLYEFFHMGINEDSWRNENEMFSQFLETLKL